MSIVVCAVHGAWSPGGFRYTTGLVHTVLRERVVLRRLARVDPPECNCDSALADESPSCPFHAKRSLLESCSGDAQKRLLGVPVAWTFPVQGSIHAVPSHNDRVLRRSGNQHPSGLRAAHRCCNWTGVHLRAIPTPPGAPNRGRRGDAEDMPRTHTHTTTTTQHY